MLKTFSEKNLLLTISFFFIIFVFINFTHNHFSKFIAKENNTFYKLDNLEFKDNINQSLTSSKTYELILDNKCEVTGSMHDRHKVRWLKSLLLKNIFQMSDKLNNELPYYINILLHSLLIFLSLIFLEQTFKLKKTYIIFFLLYITFIFQNYLGEYSYSIFEMFFASAALYASKKKNIYLFFTVCLLASLNRESGFIIILFWLIFNTNLKVFSVGAIIVIFTFLLSNFETINCILNPEFFIPLENQKGQVNFGDLNSINLPSLIKLFTINFILPFGLVFFNIIKYNIKNKPLIFITIIYLIAFLFATPIHHMAVKLIILPIIIMTFSINPEQKIKEV